MMFQRLALEPLHWSAHQLVMRFSLDALKFSTIYWYPDIDLLDLEARFGRDFVERLFVHAALLVSMKLHPGVGAVPNVPMQCAYV